MTRTFVLGTVTLCLVWLGAGHAEAQRRDQRRVPLDASALQRLQQETGADVSLDPGTGAPRFVRVKRGTFRGLARRGSAATTAERNEHSKTFFREHARLYGLTDVDGALQPVFARTDGHGWSHLTYRQVHRGVPVFGGAVKTHFDASGQLVSVSGTVVPRIQVSPTPAVSQGGAASAAMAQMTDSGDAAGLAVRSVHLMVFRTGLAKGVEGSNHLAWQVEVTNGTTIREFIYVDAHNGKVLDQITGIHDGLFRRAYDGAFLPNVPPSYPGSPFWVEGDPFPTGTVEADNMLLASKETYDFFLNAHGRDSFDGFGATMDSIFNRGYSCPNASWNGVFISFCEGLTTDDITGHEWGHAYTEYTHGLIYQWQPGALNESYSDIWGEIVDLINNRGTDAPGAARSVGTCSTFSPPRAELVLNAPASIAGTYPAQAAAFGPGLTATGVTGTVVLGDDGSTANGGTTSDGCQPLVNSDALAGNIALIDRGVCAFVVKVKNAQDAGAIGVIVANNVSSGLPGMAGTDPAITIPSIGITQADGDAIKANLPSVNATLRRGGAAEMSVRWLMGEDATATGLTGALRDMWDPTCYGDPGKVTDTAFYVCSTADAGGVHTNSGIPNHTFSLLVDGGSYNGQTIAPIGLTKAAHLYYRAAAVYQGPASDFADHADALEQSCSDLTGQPLNALTGGPSGEVITAADCSQVAKAIAATELRTPPTFCNFQTLLSQNAPDRCEVNTTQVNIFTADFESNPAGSWQVSHETPSSSFTARDWTWTNTLPDRAGAAFFGPDPNIGTCTPAGDESGVLHLDSPMISLPGGAASPRLSFDHWVATEPGWDGGNLRISVAGSGWQLVAPADFTFNSYTATLFTPAQGNTNPLAGQPAFTGTDGGSVEGSWGRSHVNLAPYVGPNDAFRLRFDMGTDGCTGRFGWYVDDVSVYTCTSNTAPTVSINDVAVVEGDKGLTDAVFTVSLSHAYANPVTVIYRVVDGTAKRGKDYLVGNARFRGGDDDDDDDDDDDEDDDDDDRIKELKLVIPPLSVSGEITVRVIGDRKLEKNETFRVVLRRVKNGTIGDGSGTGTILNDDTKHKNTDDDDDDDDR